MFFTPSTTSEAPARLSEGVFEPLPVRLPAASLLLLNMCCDAAVWLPPTSVEGWVGDATEAPPFVMAPPPLVMGPPGGAPCPLQRRSTDCAAASAAVSCCGFRYIRSVTRCDRSQARCLAGDRSALPLPWALSGLSSAAAPLQWSLLLLLTSTALPAGFSALFERSPSGRPCTGADWTAFCLMAPVLDTGCPVRRPAVWMGPAARGAALLLDGGRCCT
mmetsp:Transcript_5572/g.15967  ORF Transcript_5572/g.15967 Transcript_5572/m.15967 type:complete len:218 (-) Transcript_5572:984-1637(-)